MYGAGKVAKCPVFLSQISPGGRFGIWEFWKIWAITTENVWSRQSQRNVRFPFATPPWGGDLKFGNFGNLGDYYGECMEQAYFGEDLGD